MRLAGAVGGLRAGEGCPAPAPAPAPVLLSAPFEEEEEEEEGLGGEWPNMEASKSLVVRSVAALWEEQQRNTMAQHDEWCIHKQASLKANILQIHAGCGP